MKDCRAEFCEEKAWLGEYCEFHHNALVAEVERESRLERIEAMLILLLRAAPPPAEYDPMGPAIPTGYPGNCTCGTSARCLTHPVG